jgi:hypothetical protein
VKRSGPLLATLAPELPSRPGWIFQEKDGGIRGLSAGSPIGGGSEDLGHSEWIFEQAAPSRIPIIQRLEPLGRGLDDEALFPEEAARSASAWAPRSS